MTTNPLFRIEVQQARRASRTGRILLSRPIAFNYIVSAALFCAVAILAFLYYGQYTMRSTAVGQLIPLDGIVRLTTPAAGKIIERHVREGQAVRAGQVLFVLSGDHQYGADQFTDAAISRQVRNRQQSMREDLVRIGELYGEQTTTIHRRIDGLTNEISKLRGQVDSQNAKLTIIDASLQRLRQLQGKGFISPQQEQDKQADVYAQQVLLQSLERDLANAQRQLSEAKGDLLTLPIRRQREEASLERSIGVTEQELVESEGRRHIILSASVDGMITGLTAEVGQTVDPAHVLGSIVPAHGTLNAHLYVSSKSVGFIRPGDGVKLRYPAFPFAKFGHANGTVVSISHVAAPPSELGDNSILPATETVYLVVVALAKQHVMAYGKQEPLRAGMRVDADVMHERRHLYEWVLDPLYSISGRL